MNARQSSVSPPCLLSPISLLCLPRFLHFPPYPSFLFLPLFWLAVRPFAFAHASLDVLSVQPRARNHTRPIFTFNLWTSLFIKRGDTLLLSSSFLSSWCQPCSDKLNKSSGCLPFTFCRLTPNRKWVRARGGGIHIQRGHFYSWSRQRQCTPRRLEFCVLWVPQELLK